MNLKRTNCQALMAISALLALASCVSPAVVEDDFGNSVRQMVLAQRAHPTVSESPDPDEPDTSDGQRAVNALGVYRGDVTPPLSGNAPAATGGSQSGGIQGGSQQ